MLHIILQRVEITGISSSLIARTYRVSIFFVMIIIHIHNSSKVNSSKRHYQEPRTVIYEHNFY